MKRAIKVIVACVAIVAVVSIASSVAGQAAVPIIGIQTPDVSIKNLAATANHQAQTISLSWDAITGEATYNVKYTPAGGSSTTVSAATNSWTHSNAVAGKQYTYQVQADPEDYTDGPWSSGVTAKLKPIPAISSGTFVESTNTITLTVSENVKSATASNVCIYNTVQLSDGSYQPFDRCGSSATISGSTVTVVVSGEYGNVTMTSEAIGVGSKAVYNKDDLYNAQAEIVLYP